MIPQWLVQPSKSDTIFNFELRKNRKISPPQCTIFPISEARSKYGWIWAVSFIRYTTPSKLIGRCRAVKEKEGKLGAHAMKRVAAGAHLPTPWWRLRMIRTTHIQPMMEFKEKFWMFTSKVDLANDDFEMESFRSDISRVPGFIEYKFDISDHIHRYHNSSFVGAVFSDGRFRHISSKSHPSKWCR